MSDVFTSILQREGMGKNITISVTRAGHYPTLDLVALYSAQKGVGAAITGTRSPSQSGTYATKPK